MAIERMRLVQITGDVSQLDRTLLVCSKSGAFHPELVVQPGEKDHGYTQFSQDNPWRPLLGKVTDIALACSLDLIYTEPGDNKSDSGEENAVLDEFMNDFLTDFQKKMFSLSEEKNALLGAIEQGSSALEQLEHMDNLDVSLDEIFACKNFEVRFGRLPIDSYKKLGYYADQNFLFAPLQPEGDYQWGVYFTTEDFEAEVDDIFASLYFERVWIPEYVHGTPGMAKANLEMAVRMAKEELKATEELLGELVHENAEAFLSIYSYLRFRDESFELRKYVSVYRNQFHLVGFFPKAEQAALEGELAAVGELTVEFRPQDSDKRLITPTKLKNNWLFRPFEMFVDMYGTPAYTEIDPTPFLGMTYILLFGIMFGDLGQGLVIALLGVCLSKFKKMEFGKILTRIGISAACFGVVYGSVFGLEHLLDPFYTDVLGLPGKPVEVMDPLTINNLLLVAVGLGIFLILSAMTINIVMGFKNQDWEKAIFSNNGIAGMVFYLSVLVGAVSMLTGGPNLFTAPYILGFILFPILIIFLKHPLGKLAKGSREIKPEDGIGSFVIEGIFELFEVALSFVTNTLSFLRVGGFIISHAGMMAVVLTLTEMMTGAGSLAALVIGNLFVMALEGFIVGIQSLRLEFYELFSRYFEGQGKPFRPIAAPACAGVTKAAQ